MEFLIIPTVTIFFSVAQPPEHGAIGSVRRNFLDVTREVPEVPEVPEDEAVNQVGFVKNLARLLDFFWGDSWHVGGCWWMLVDVGGCWCVNRISPKRLFPKWNVCV